MSKKISLENVKNIVDEFIVANNDFLAGIEFVIGVSRGGFVPAALLAVAIDKPLVAAYIDESDGIFFDRADWINGKNILVVDDIVRSGKTLWLLKKNLEANSAPKSISFFTLFKVESLENKNYNIPSFSRKTSEDVVFPWDYDRK